MIFIAVFSLLSVSVPFATSTSDPASILCDTVCWEEGVQMDQCLSELTCDLDPLISDAEFMACREPCWGIAAPCRRRCRRAWYRGALRKCSRSSSRSSASAASRRCTGQGRDLDRRCAELSHMECVLDKMMSNRARWLAVSRQGLM